MDNGYDKLKMALKEQRVNIHELIHQSEDIVCDDVDLHENHGFVRVTLELVLINKTEEEHGDE